MPGSSEFPLRKMQSHVDENVGYTLGTPDGPLSLGPLVGQQLTVEATGRLSCTSCSRPVRKFYGQGFCFPCFQNAPEAAECIVRPELCRAHLGEGRDVDWEIAHHATEHIVYLSRTSGASDKSSGMKVGVTRSTQVPTRWIDQGAVAAIAIARVPYRQLAGLIEVDLKGQLADRTDWRAMLRSVDPAAEDLIALRDRIPGMLRSELQPYLLQREDPLTLHYPIMAYPAKVSSVQLGKTAKVSGTLVGIKGQYLIWEDGQVLNIRNHSGYHVLLSWSEYCEGSRPIG